MKLSLVASAGAVVPSLSGCVALWGGSCKVGIADEKGIAIQYDRSLSSSAKAAAVAREHCKKYGRIAEPDDARMPGLLLGIIEETYLCKSA